MEKLSINSRRYFGNKYKLIDFIKDITYQNIDNSDFKTFADVFCGTGAVASAFTDKILVTNDILYSSYLSHVAWFDESKPYDSKKLELLINSYNELKVSDDNYMSDSFAGTFFSLETSRKIGAIREDVEKLYNANNINFREKAILITSLIYAFDKIAKSFGHYDAYRKNEAGYNDNLILKMPDINKGLSKKNRCFNIDANLLVKTIKADVVYLDPPYNSRQYGDAYHLLENVAKWEKPEVFGTAKKMNRDDIKSTYSTSSATESFERLIKDIDAKLILMSYNNTGQNSTARSNALISDKEILRILRDKGDVTVVSKKHKAFTTGKSKNDANEERIFICKVKN